MDISLYQSEIGGISCLLYIITDGHYVRRFAPNRRTWVLQRRTLLIYKHDKENMLRYFSKKIDEPFDTRDFLSREIPVMNLFTFVEEI